MWRIFRQATKKKTAQPIASISGASHTAGHPPPRTKASREISMKYRDGTKDDIQRSPAGTFETGKINPDSRNESRNCTPATAWIAVAWFGIATPTITPKQTLQSR